VKSSEVIIRPPTLNPRTGNVAPSSRPAFIGLGHELIHAERASRGLVFGEDEKADFTFQISRQRRFWLFGRWITNYQTIEDVLKEELATIGLGFHDDCCDITENDLRYEHGLNPRGAFLMEGEY